MTEERDEMYEAEALDRAIDEGSAGRRPEGDAGDLVVLLAATHRPPLPKDARGRIGRRVEELTGRRVLGVPIALRLTAALLGLLFLQQGVPSLFAPAWLADFLELRLEPHVYQEAGILAIGLAAAALAGAIKPRLLSGVVAAIVPAGLALGVFGGLEIAHAPNPGAEVLHIVQAVVAAVLGVLWLRWRRGT